VSVDMNFGNQDWGVKHWVEGGKSGELCVSEEDEWHVEAFKQTSNSPHPSNPFKTISTKSVFRSITNKLVVCFRKHRSSFDTRLQVE
jgi:hypothetical protein